MDNQKSQDITPKDSVASVYLVPPTSEQIKEYQKYTSEKIDREKERIRQARQSEYQQKADPIFFKWQAGEATKEEWLDIRSEINSKYPYPT